MHNTETQCIYCFQYMSGPYSLAALGVLLPPYHGVSKFFRIRHGNSTFILFEPGGILPFAQWSPETLGAGSVLPFALTNSPHFRLRRTAHRADIRLLCHSLRSYGSDPCLAQTNRKSSPQGRAFSVGDMTAKGNFRTLRMLDDLFTFSK